MDEAGCELNRKRRIKRQVAADRRLPSPPLSGTNSATIPIEAHHCGHYVHHNASVEDLRAVLALLPAAATEGISSIELILGKEFIDEEYGGKHDERDIFTGRLSHERLPGIYSGLCLGTYAPHSGQIALHAHVYDPDKLPLKQNLCELYLKLRALKTFVHEVAHHHDHANRVRRGRWLADRKENVEWYAEKMEHEWAHQIVVPYLEKTYAADVSEFLDFVEQQGGLRLPLEFFAGDSRSTLRNGLIRFAFTTNEAFESWVEKLPNCENLEASRLAFTWELHFADNYEACLQVLERVLSEKPDLTGALTCKGDTLIHLERYDEAFVIAERVLATDPANGDAWEIRGDVFEARQDWHALLENCDSWLTQVPEDSRSRFDAFQHRAVAYCALGDMEKMESSIEAWASFGNRKRKLEFIRKSVFRRAGQEQPQ